MQIWSGSQLQLVPKSNLTYNTSAMGEFLNTRAEFRETFRSQSFESESPKLFMLGVDLGFAVLFGIEVIKAPVLITSNIIKRGFGRLAQW